RGGAVEVFGRDVSRLSVGDSARLVGFVFQDPDAQMVCDSVWHEMSFGLESLGTPPPEMRRRVAETCHFFGIEPWFGRDVATLSGGQRQVLALASALAMRPRLLLLDEPTKGLDARAQAVLADELWRLAASGAAVLMASHDPNFVRQVADVTSMLFDGGVAATEKTPSFFEGSVFFRD
ncbi:MAG: ABC transporter ATP-binding protein, partial [Atopobiaceae bacterium]